MRDSLERRLKRLERAQGTLPHGIVEFTDGHKEKLDLQQIAAAFLEQNRAGIVAVEWTRPADTAAIFQLLSCPETWEGLSKERKD